MGVSLRPALFPRVKVGVGVNPSWETFTGISGGRENRHSGVVVEGIDLLTADGVLVRMMPPGSLEQVVFRMDAPPSRGRRRSGPQSPAGRRGRGRQVSDALTAGTKGHCRAGDLGRRDRDRCSGSIQGVGGDVVVKPLFGSEGRGLMRVSDTELAWRTFHALERLNAVLYLQRVVRHPGHDVRVFVLRGNVLGAMRRHAQPGEWRTNVSLGGRAEPWRLDCESEGLALAAARAIGAEMAGVDLIMDLDLDRMVVLEVNAVPGWRALCV